MKKIPLLLLVFGLSSPGFCENSDWNLHKGTYAEMTAGTMFNISDGVGAPSGGLGLTGAVGYQFTNRVGLELGALGIHNSNYDYSSTLAALPYLSSRFTVPIKDRYSFIGKLGVMSGGSSHPVLPFAGVGVGYALTKKVDLSVQYQGLAIPLMNVLGVGVTYHF